MKKINEEQLDSKKVLAGIKKFQKLFGTKAPLDVRKYPKSIGTTATVYLPMGLEFGTPEQLKKHKQMQKIIKALKLPISKLDSVKGEARFWVQYGVDESVNEDHDPFKPEYGTGEVVHDCPKHVEETKTKTKGKVVGHTLNEAGEVNYLDVNFGTGKIYKNIPTKKLKVLESNSHQHEVKEEPNVNELRSTIRSMVRDIIDKKGK